MQLLSKSRLCLLLLVVLGLGSVVLASSRSSSRRIDLGPGTGAPPKSIRPGHFGSQPSADEESILRDEISKNLVLPVVVP